MKIRSGLIQGRKPRIEMLPLIDIVFLLLVFFIYAMLSMAVHRGLPVTLPGSATAPVEHRDMVALTVRADGRIFVGKQEVGLDRLSEVLAERVRAHRDSPGAVGVQVFGDRSVDLQQLYAVLDRVRQAGVTRISLQARAVEHKTDPRVDSGRP